MQVRCIILTLLFELIKALKFFFLSLLIFWQNYTKHPIYGAYSKVVFILELIITVEVAEIDMSFLTYLFYA